MNVSTKRRMYELLAGGAFGNTVPQYFDLLSWRVSADHGKYPLWGIRSGLAGADKRCRLNVPTEEVGPLYTEWFGAMGGNISPMIDRWAILRAEVWESHIGPFGLTVFFADGFDPTDPWRGSFRKYGRQVNGIEANMLLKRNLWPSDLEDLRATLDAYPGHVVELSACSRAVGVLPSRNTVIWEVRNY